MFNIQGGDVIISTTIHEETSITPLNVNGTTTYTNILKNQNSRVQNIL
jgi:hypothetical protein